MSSSPPPTYVVNIYNPAYFTSSTTGLTQAQANNLYLQKGTPDTATALETFTSGIATNTLQTTSITGDLSIYPAQTSGNIYLGANSTSSTGRTGTIHIGDGNSMPVGATIHINNGTSNASNTNIMNGTSTSGTCNILTGSTTSGTCNIATGTGATQTSTVNIGSGSTTGTVTIGNSANTVTIKSADITMGTGKNIVLQPASGYVIPTSTQLGYLKVGTLKASSTVISSGTTEIGSITLDAGSWIISAYCNISPNAITTDNLGFRYSLNTTSAVISTSYLLIGSEGVTYTAISTAPTLAGTAMVSITSSQTYYLNVTVNLISGTITLGTVTHWNAMRIA